MERGCYEGKYPHTAKDLNGIEFLKIDFSLLYAFLYPWELVLTRISFTSIPIDQRFTTFPHFSPFGKLFRHFFQMSPHS